MLPPHVLHPRPPLRGILLRLHSPAEQDLEGDARHNGRLCQGLLRRPGADNQGTPGQAHGPGQVQGQVAATPLRHHHEPLAAGKDISRGVGKSRHAHSRAQGPNHTGHDRAHSAAALGIFGRGHEVHEVQREGTSTAKNFGEFGGMWN